MLQLYFPEVHTDILVMRFLLYQVFTCISSIQWHQSLQTKIKTPALRTVTSRNTVVAIFFSDTVTKITTVYPSGFNFFFSFFCGLTNPYFCKAWCKAGTEILIILLVNRLHTTIFMWWSYFSRSTKWLNFLSSECITVNILEINFKLLQINARTIPN